MNTPAWRPEFKYVASDKWMRNKIYIPLSAKPGEEIPVTMCEGIQVTSPGDRERQDLWRVIIEKAKAADKVGSEFKAAFYYRLGACEWDPESRQFLFLEERSDRDATRSSIIDMPLEEYGFNRFCEAVLWPAGSYALSVRTFDLEKVITPDRMTVITPDRGINVSLTKPSSSRNLHMPLPDKIYLKWSGLDAQLKIYYPDDTLRIPLERIIAIKYNLEVRTILVQIRRSGLSKPEEVLFQLRPVSVKKWMTLQTCCYHLFKGDEHGIHKCSGVSEEYLLQKEKDLTNVFFQES